MKCQDCEYWNNGLGMDPCLRCKDIYYKANKKQYVKPVIPVADMSVLSESSKLKEILKVAMETSSYENFVMFVRHYLMDDSLRDIAKDTGLGKSTVKDRLDKILKTVKENINGT